jgi:hypothetical protein
MSNVRIWHLAALAVVAVSQALAAMLGLFVLWTFATGEIRGTWWTIVPIGVGLIVSGAAGHLIHRIDKSARRP